VIVLRTTCQNPGCGLPLTDRFSRTIGYGPECRKKLTPAELVAAIRANNPATAPIPEQRPASARAQVVNDQARRTAAEAARPVDCDRHPGHRKAACPVCRSEDGVQHIADRVIEETRAKRTADRDRAYQQWVAAHGGAR
jgi:hypothetical protein